MKKSSKIDVSIIIPIYKGKQYIESIMPMINRNNKYVNKYFECNIELILVNDYPIETLEIKNSDIETYIISNEKNLGIHSSRVRGLDRARGEFVIFFDQDDVMADEHLYFQMKNIGKSDVVICNGVYRNGKVIMPNDLVKERVKDPEYYIYSMIEIISPGQALIRRESIPKEWKKYILKENYCDDAFLWILMKNQGCIFEINDNITYTHTENGENTSFGWKNNARALSELQKTLMENHLLGFQYEEGFKKNIEEKIRKHIEYADLEKKFFQLSEEITLLEDYLKEKNFRQIVVYGYGIFGKKLIELINRTEFKANYVIDKNAESFCNTDIKIFDMEGELPKADIVIVTATFAYEQIKRELEKKGIKEVINLKDMLEQILA